MEVHLFDFEGDLYDRELRVGFVARIRSKIDGRVTGNAPLSLAMTVRRFYSKRRPLAPWHSCTLSTQALRHPRTLAPLTLISCPLMSARPEIESKIDRKRFQEHHWEGSLWDYMDTCVEKPHVARNAFQRVYDMVLSYGWEKYRVFKQDVIRYHFFSDPIDHGADAIYGLDRPLMELVDVFRSASEGYGTDRRILLLHGPVGSSKSTIDAGWRSGVRTRERHGRATREDDTSLAKGGGSGIRQVGRVARAQPDECYCGAHVETPAPTMGDVHALTGATVLSSGRKRTTSEPVDVVGATKR